MRILIIMVALYALSGCAALTTPSSYSNHNTPNGNVVTARGRAAENAASANTSHNCPSCGSSTQTSNSGYYGSRRQPQPSKEAQFVEAVKVDFYNNLRSLFNYKTTERIYDR